MSQLENICDIPQKIVRMKKKFNQDHKIFFKYTHKVWFYKLKMNSNILQNKEHFINKRQYQASLSSCSLFVQSVPLQPEQRGVQRSPAFLHLQLRLHPCLHPQLINFSTFCGAAGLSFTTGTRFSFWDILVQPHSVGGNSLPNH